MDFSGFPIFGDPCEESVAVAELDHFVVPPLQPSPPVVVLDALRAGGDLGEELAMEV